MPSTSTRFWPLIAIGGVAGLRAGAVAADVDAAHRRPHGVTASSDHRSREFGISCSASSLKFCWTRVFEVSMTGESPVTVTVSFSDATAELDVHRRGEAHRDLDVFTLQGVEARQLEGHRVGARRQRRKR